MIEIKGLNKFFNKGKSNEIHVINDVSLTLPEKGMVAIFGKSGCGKTTLLNIIGGLDSFTGGSLNIEGNDICKNTDDIRNKYIGYIFQNYNLNKTETCFDNVAAALRLCGMNDEEEIKSRVSAALKNVGMENYAKRSPDTLSGGQQQRIAIARAIVKNPRIILADEPTGNLDESNTVKIMDLLKAISREHLVILVTHEANLVDYYCDTVIELSDGKVVGVKNNAVTNGFAARDKNDIYLGELEKHELSDSNALIEYYGDKPNSPINLKIINSGGKIYIQIGTDKVHMLDETSEIKVREGIYEESAGAEKKSEESLNMSALPRVEATKTGSLFSFKSSIKSGYKANFGKDRKKGKKLLKGFMALFAAVIVFISAIFGTAFKDIAKADGAYNHNVFYLYTPDEKTSDVLISALSDKESAIDYLRLMRGYPQGDVTFSFKAGSFETFGQYDSSTVFGTNAVPLDASLIKDLPLIEGKKDSLSSSEAVITTRVAEALLQKSSLGYIEEAKDLIGLVITNYMGSESSVRIAGIVESDETAIYMNSVTMARYSHNYTSASYTALASDFGITLAEGETILAITNNRSAITYPALNEKIKIQGVEFTVKEIVEAHYQYESWLSANGISKMDEYTYFSSMVKAQNPDISEDSAEFAIALESAKNENFFLYYDYYYSDIEEYYRDLFFFEPHNFEIWMYLEKGVEEARFVNLPETYYKANVYKKLYGRYPTLTELEAASQTLPYFYLAVKEYYPLYEDEFYSQSYYYSGLYSDVYLVSDADYISLSRRVGETHPSAEKGDKYYYYDPTDENTVPANAVYTLIHSTDPEKTENWLRSHIENIDVYSGYRIPFMTPDDVRDAVIEDNTQEIVTNIITMSVIIAITSLCMYFIMHASVMNRIKEIGIYRAIGVSRKNLIFKFFVEAALLTALTVVSGYILSSAFIGVLMSGSSLMTDILYYPVWLALSVFGIVCLIPLFFGTLPIILLLKKTPSQILAKYDI